MFLTDEQQAILNGSDTEWTAYVAENNNDLSAEYKKSE